MMRSVTGNRGHDGPRLRARRGALLMLLGVMCIGLVAIGAMSIDMSRLGVLRSELQVAADAGAHAGMVELILNPAMPATALASATAYAQANTALQVTPTVEELELGIWNPITSTFTAGGGTPNAIRIMVNVQSAGLLMGIVGIDPPLVHATAIASIVPGSSPVKPALVR